jgi:hypothetical protein
MRVHFLAVFPEDFTSDKIERVFSDSNIPGVGERGGDEVLDARDVHEVAERVHKNGGLIIAAHVDSEDGGGYRAAFRAAGNGMLNLLCGDEKELDAKARAFCEQFKEHLADAKINAVEIHSPEVAKHYRFKLRDNAVEIATVLRNDAHNLGDLAEGRCSYMKMSAVGFRGLQQALRFPDTRIRHSRPSSGVAYIEGIRISGSDGKFRDTTLAFSPNLTCIIGARGTGKSATVDAIRYVFGYNRSMGTDIKDLAGQIKDRQKENFPGGKIEVVYRAANGERYILSSQFDPKNDYATVVLDENGAETGIPDVERHTGFPCRLYGWGEIEKLGRDPASQRKLLDHILDLHDLLGERKRLVGDLGTQRAQLKAKAEQLEQFYRESTKLQGLKELERQFERLQQPGMDGLFERLESADARLVAAREWESEVSKWLRTLQNAVKLPPGPHETLKALWKSAEGQTAATSVVDAARGLVAAGSKLLLAATELREKCEMEHKAASAELGKKLEANANVTVLASRRRQVGPDLTKAKADKAQYEKALAKLRDELKHRQELVRSLNDCAGRLLAAREAGVGRVAEILKGHPGANIGLALNPRSDARDYDSWVDGVLAKGKVEAARRRHILSVLKSHFGTDGTVNAMLDAKLDDCGLGGADQDRVRDGFLPFYPDGASGVTRVHPNVLDATLAGDECVMDDSVDVTLNEVSIGNRSPGQVCSAILPIILLRQQRAPHTRSAGRQLG